MTNNRMKISRQIIGAVLLQTLILAGCETSQTKYKDPREHDSAMKTAYDLQSKIIHSVTADAETIPVKATADSDAADDPAIWFNAVQPEKSVIVGTDKKSGLYTYTLEGEEIAFLPLGRVNNVDIREQSVIGNDTLTIVSASNRTNNSISILELDSLGKLKELKVVSEGLMDDVYGYCMYQNEEGVPYFILNSKDGSINIYTLSLQEKGNTLHLERSLKVGSQPEGMVADDETGILYIGEEAKGVWKVDLKNDQSKLQFIASTSIQNNEFLVADVEGIALYKTGVKSGYLVASSQGNFSYAIFDLESEEYLKSFKIVDGLLDGVEETDGLEISNQVFGEKYKKGILVVQDGFNYDNDSLISQNFKIISWEKVQAIIDQSM